MTLIDKDALVAEIERRLHFDNNWIEGDKRRQMHTNGVSTAYYKRIGSKHACENVLDFVNTLEVKEVDLKKEIDDFMVKEWDGIEDEDKPFYDMIKNDLSDIAKHFFELGMAVGNKAQKGE